MSIVFRYFITRSLTTIDFNKVLISLIDANFDPVIHPKGYVFRGGRYLELDVPGLVVDRELGVFAGKSDTVVLEYKEPHFSVSNCLLLTFRGPDWNTNPLAEIQTILADTLDLIADTIYNDRRQPVIGMDSNSALSLFMNFDVDAAVAAMTKPNPYEPNTIDKALFECWSCRTWKPWFDFHKTCFLQELDFRVVNGKAKWCTVCDLKSTVDVPF
jgi:hypothetical protein